jgi:hypothetical protein
MAHVLDTFFEMMGLHFYQLIFISSICGDLINLLQNQNTSAQSGCRVHCLLPSFPIKKPFKKTSERACLNRRETYLVISQNQSRFSNYKQSQQFMAPLEKTHT